MRRAPEPEPARPIRFPASMGLSVYLPREPSSGPDSIDVELSYANYDPIEIAEDTEDKTKTGWKRVSHGPIRLAVTLDPKLLAEGIAVPHAGSGLRVVGSFARQLWTALVSRRAC